MLYYCGMHEHEIRTPPLKRDDQIVVELPQERRIGWNVAAPTVAAQLLSASGGGKTVVQYRWCVASGHCTVDITKQFEGVTFSLDRNLDAHDTKAKSLRINAASRHTCRAGDETSRAERLRRHPS